MKKKLRYENVDITAAITNLNKRNQELYYRDENYSIDEATAFQSKTDVLLEKYNEELSKNGKGACETYYDLKQNIYMLDDELSSKEKALRNIKIRNGVTFGIGALLAPTGIPAAIIVSKKLKEAFSEGYGD